MLPKPWEEPTLQAIGSLDKWISENANAEYQQFHDQYNTPYISKPLANPWEIGQHLGEWEAPVTPSQAPQQFRRMWTIRTNAIEQDNNLIYAAYTVDGSTSFELGIIRRMAPTEVNYI